MPPRRVVRSSSDTEQVYVAPISFWQKICRIFSFLWSCIRVIWYWFERVFLIVFLVLLTIWLAWWLSQKASLYRDWEPMDSLLPEISWSGDTVTIAHIRDHVWTTDHDFTPRYYTGTYNLDDLEKVYYIITPFSDRDGPAHTMLSFSFSGWATLAISAELRKERGESFDAVKGILNQYELQYIVASENDIIKLRTNYRKNQVYMYPINTPKEKIKAIFRSMLVRTDKLTREPEFYNTLWNNCTTSILQHANALREEKLIGWTHTLLPAHSDEIVYDAWLIDTQLSLSDARAYYRIDELARSGSGTTDFSALIRKPIQ